jgi:hypothetical protein
MLLCKSAGKYSVFFWKDSAMFIFQANTRKNGTQLYSDTLDAVCSPSSSLMPYWNRRGRLSASDHSEQYTRHPVLTTVDEN